MGALGEERVDRRLACQRDVSRSGIAEKHRRRAKRGRDNREKERSYVDILCFIISLHFKIPCRCVGFVTDDKESILLFICRFHTNLYLSTVELNP